MELFALILNKLLIILYPFVVYLLFKVGKKDEVIGDLPILGIIGVSMLMTGILMMVFRVYVYFLIGH